MRRAELFVAEMVDAKRTSHTGWTLGHQWARKPGKAVHHGVKVPVLWAVHCNSCGRLSTGSAGHLRGRSIATARTCAQCFAPKFVEMPDQYGEYRRGEFGRRE